RRAPAGGLLGRRRRLGASFRPPGAAPPSEGGIRQPRGETMSDEPVVVERVGEVAVVRLVGGARGDLLDQAAWDALRRASLQLSDAPPRVAILAGAPGFSRGLDPSPHNPIVRDLERLGR